MIFSAGPLTPVGRIIKTHGYEGKLRIDIDDYTDIDLKEPLFLMFDQKPVPFFITEHTKSNPYIVSFADIDTLEKAQKIQGKDLYAPVHQVEYEEDGSFVGFTLVDSKLGVIGKVESVIDTGAQELIQTTYRQRECLIPLVEDFIVEVNEDKQKLTMNIPEGLLNLD